MEVAIEIRCPQPQVDAVGGVRREGVGICHRIGKNNSSLVCSVNEHISGGGIAAQGQQDQGGEADDEMFLGFLTGSENVQGASIHNVFLFAAIPSRRILLR